MFTVSITNITNPGLEVKRARLPEASGIAEHTESCQLHVPTLFLEVRMYRHGR